MEGLEGLSKKEKKGKKLMDMEDNVMLSGGKGSGGRWRRGGGDE